MNPKLHLEDLQRQYSRLNEFIGNIHSGADRLRTEEADLSGQVERAEGFSMRTGEAGALETLKETLAAVRERRAEAARKLKIAEKETRRIDAEIHQARNALDQRKQAVAFDLAGKIEARLTGDHKFREALIDAWGHYASIGNSSWPDYVGDLFSPPSDSEAERAIGRAKQAIEEIL